MKVDIVAQTDTAKRKRARRPLTLLFRSLSLLLLLLLPFQLPNATLKQHKMGTLTSYSFSFTPSPVDFKFPSNPHCRERIGFPELTKWRNSCLLCRERSSKRMRKNTFYRNFDRFRCFSLHNDDNNDSIGDGESSGEASTSRDSNAAATTTTTTAPPEEPPDEFNSDKTTPPASVSSKVTFFFFFFN